VIATEPKKRRREKPWKIMEKQDEITSTKSYKQSLNSKCA
jgi:hypothetical protein